MLQGILGRPRTGWLCVNNQSQGNEPGQAAARQGWSERPTNKAPSLFAHLILAVEFLVGYVGWEIGVKQCTESQPIVPAAAEVCDVDILREKKKRDVVCSLIFSGGILCSRRTQRPPIM